MLGTYVIWALNIVFSILIFSIRKHLDDYETLPNFMKTKHLRDGEKKETRGKDQSLGKQTIVQKRQATRRKGIH
jgi:hypothetical protein